MKIKAKKTKEQRLKIVMDIINKFKKFPRADFYQNRHADSAYIDLYNQEFPAIKKLHEVFMNYINQDDNNPRELIGFSGEIYFEELDKIIEYRLPININTLPLLVLRHKP